MKNLHIEGRLWFQKSNGNTYHTTRIFHNGAMIFSSPRQYGYGDQFLQTAFDWLAENGVPELAEIHPNGCRKNANTIYLRETMESTYSRIDVTRKGDL